MDEQRKYEVIKRLADDNGSKDRTALELGITKRQVNRLIKKYKENGKEAFQHGNRGRKPATKISGEKRSATIDLYRTKYYDANFTHYTELLETHEHISISASAVASILESEYILSPKVTKTKKNPLHQLYSADKEGLPKIFSMQLSANHDSTSRPIQK